MSAHTCPLCGKESFCRKEQSGENGYVRFYCDTYHIHFCLADEILNKGADIVTYERLLDLVTEQLVHSPNCIINGIDYYWHFFYQPGYQIADNDPSNYINLADRIGNYPINILDKVNRGLLNLSFYYPHYGDIIEISNENRRLIFERNNNNSHGLYGVSDFYVEMGFFNKIRQTLKVYTLSSKGWQKIEELRKNELTLKQGFIAMQFGKQTEFIREAFRTAIHESGYNARFIDEKEHNNQIVPEILYEISRSRFMVVDMTFQNYGAYYEAGYGQALGKEVIICCRKEEFDSLEKKPHFDIAQKSMIVWTDEADLVARLKRRIEATVK